MLEVPSQQPVQESPAMGLRALPSKTWQVNRGWVIAANIAAGLAAWRLALPRSGQ